MDQNELQNLLKLRVFTKAHSLKTITQLLLSVSVISLFLYNATVLSVIHSLNIYFSTFPAKLFSHTIDKNCIFLLCNGLLVFVTKYSGLSGSSSSKFGRSGYKSFKDYNDDIPQSVSESGAPVLKRIVVEESAVDDQKSAAMEHEEKEKEYEELNVEDEEGEGERELLVEEDGQIAVKMLDNEFLMQEDDDDNDVEVEVGNRLLSAEELNKKFDEFIRKMKEEIRIEGQQQLVMVN